ncbi:MAG TPA: DNA repair protein RecN [Bacilli bacterium]|mgnify:FL=1|nr:DNA repair protein RecN [Acholeplasmataceae bacterium]HOC97865.1 DNA repair protein RecN [Bacilli bacterium]HPA98858.1 DNA repair protein RecN [Bacilli bacterium]HPX82913.1 DNA repair protein RecN [Bacilli bacterium]HQB79684.1 DNA repair protein RecN [Bacilli bacterium]
MLQRLIVKNFAIIENIEIEFKDKMTVLSGETGAGKSLIIDAIGLLFGKRASVDLIRYKETKATITGIFTNTKEILEYLKDKDLNLGDGESLIISRDLYLNSSSVAKVNSDVVSINILAELGELIGDIHNQFDSQALTHPKNYLNFLADDVTKDKLSNYKVLLNEYKQTKKEYDALVKENEENTKQIDFIKYQLKELKAAHLTLTEEEDLKNQENYLKNYEVISTAFEEIKELLEDRGSLDNIASSFSRLSALKINPEAEELIEKIKSSYYELEASYDELKKMNRLLEYDPEALEQINERLSVYSSLKRKYKLNTEGLINLEGELADKVSKIDTYDLDLKEIKAKLDKSYSNAYKEAETISKLRKEKAVNFEKEITANLRDLELIKTNFKIEFTKLNELSDNGFDKVDFLVSFNEGEPLKSLSKVASGGELSRFMLALKVMINEKMNYQTMIFDEIDSGVSGKTAYAIASKLKQIANFSQVLSVTHLPQVAAIADSHLFISKEVLDGRTITKLKHLENEGRVIEIAKMISNGIVTDASYNLALELLKK